ncbi:hypothetical protein ACQKP0_14400 [Heyndrickxia sp. NPDC080065]|uniref:hypothetical protein n=1 Tax=Heyndrickxia sp. NPDC080065 TaxID=3390568 RepID=UPI003D065CA5
MNKWIATLFNIGGRNNFLKMLGIRRNNRGMMWMSLLGVGVSAAIFGLSRNRNKNMLGPLQNFMKNSRMPNFGQMQNMATEFSKELMPNNDQSNKK